ncbi:sodium:solute symporter family protein [Candidatus Dependentiae bacterium]|nr:sodium:solute symporter family protein [Candidatus Dependentiae bacterium]
MSMTLFLTVFSGLSIIYLLLGYFASRNIKTTNDYFLAGRDLGIASVTFTLIATQLGGGMLLGTSQEAHSVGLYGILYTLGMGFGFLILGLGFAQKLRSLNVATTAELFETRYGSPILKKFASILSIVTLCGILIAQIVAVKGLLVGLGITNEFLFIAFWVFVILYTMLGGLKAVVITDIFQVLYIIFLFGFIFLYSLWQEPSNFFTLANIGQAQSMFGTTAITMSSFTGTLLMPALFSLIEQDLAQRFFAARTTRIAAISALLSSCFLLLFSLVPIYFGMKAQLLGITLPDSASPLLPVIEFLTNNIISSLALCGVIAAITSTADSLLCAISSNIAQDFDFPFIDNKNKLWLSQAITLITGCVAVAASYFVPQNIISILIGSYEVSVSCLLVPLLFCYFKTRVKKQAAVGAIVFGLAGFVLFRILPLPQSIPRELATLALSVIGYLIGSKKF